VVSTSQAQSLVAARGLGGLSGDYLCGVIVEDRPVTYGPNHRTKPGQAVPGLRELEVEVGAGWRRKASYYESAGGRPTAVAAAVTGAGGPEAIVGRHAVMLVIVKPAGKYVNRFVEAITFTDEA
jgi:hypothetical protein